MEPLDSARDLATELRAFLDLPLRQPGDLDVWNQRVQELTRRIERATGASFSIPPGIWRFLFDADLRLSRAFEFDDSRDHFIEAIEQLEAGG